ncbi:polysaccharide deacetylase family protein [Idiomarina abyssalis]|uniref:polysaccharide deacetylase family protein n=1 Tax=Idiomarina abyssalis TaxID=86102 RepID=UPI001C976A1C|nr:polysaccharide deacetylase family protein [Idiomarina abyssalis]QZN91407.1 polysaccharide deacetylase family protein [Idiomarina abyssalis]
MEKVTVVMYHYVRNILTSRYPSIKGLEYEDFLGQLKYIKKHYTPITIEQLSDSFKHGTDLPKNPVLLTFDDAYIDHFKYVYPTLKKFGMQGSFYAPVKAVTEGSVLDVNKIHFILASCTNIKDLLTDFNREYDLLKSRFDVDSYEALYEKIAVSNRFDSGDIIFFKRALQVALPESMRSQITSKLFEKHVGMSEEAFSEELYMDKRHLQHLVNDGMHVGSHGYDHYWWNKLSGEQLDNELDKSIHFLDSLGATKNVLSACYPYGSWSDSVVNKLVDKGFDLGFTTEVNLAHPSTSHKLIIPRLDTNDLPKSEFDEKNSWHPDSL